MGDELRELLEEVRAGPCFAVLADEAADHSNQEMLPLVLRFVDRLGEIQVVVDFLMCNEGVSGEALADMILSALQSYQLDLSRLRGQGYDGAGNMAVVEASFPNHAYKMHQKFQNAIRMQW